MNILISPVDNKTIVSSIPSWNEPIRTIINIDPLACSVSLHRRNQKTGLVTASNDIINSDISLAKDIRSYYSKKYLWNKLKDATIQSVYQDNALRLLSITENWQLTDREAGLFIKLPWFYAEDKVYDIFRKELHTDKKLYTKNSHTSTFEEHHLTYINKTVRWLGKIKSTSFWFKNDANQLFAFNNPNNNPLISLFEKTIQPSQNFVIKYTASHIADMWYNEIKEFDFS